MKKHERKMSDGSNKLGTTKPKPKQEPKKEVTKDATDKK